MHYLFAFWAMGRPLFLLGALPLYMLGVSLAWYDGYKINLSTLLSGLALTWLIQLETHYNNEYRDLATDRAVETPTRISGGSRVLVKGLVPAKVARFAGIIAFALAVAMALSLTFALGAGYLTLLFAGVALIIGWGYSEPSLKLDSRGLGETAIVLLSCFLLPITAYYIQTSSVSLTLLLVSIPLALIIFAVTLATEVPDIASDRATGKITLAVRMQRKKSVKLHLAFFIAGCLSLIAVLIWRWPFIGWVSVMITIPVIVTSIICGRASSNGDIKAMERTGLLYSFVLGFGAVALNVALIVGSQWFI
ncbi:MAG: prenyltransferase [Dehalococcoidia bacterium]|nr:prenyltransferase [Dehalococcoidia bacterium]